jgi:hypothetical protein
MGVYSRSPEATSGHPFAYRESEMRTRLKEGGDPEPRICSSRGSMLSEMRTRLKEGGDGSRAWEFCRSTDGLEHSPNDRNKAPFGGNSD